MDGLEGGEALRVELDDAPHEATVSVVGELDLATAPLLDEAVDSFGDPDSRQLTVDMAGLAFMDSSGLAVLLKARQAGWKVVLRRPARPVREVVEASGLAGVLEIES